MEQPGSTPLSQTSQACRLDLSTPTAKRDAAQALPALMLAAAMGSTPAVHMAGQIIGQTFADAMQPSFDALDRLTRQNRISQ